MDSERIEIRALSIDLQKECVALVDVDGDLVIGEVVAQFKVPHPYSETHTIFQATRCGKGLANSLGKPLAMWVTERKDGVAFYRAPAIGTSFDMGWSQGTFVQFVVEEARARGTRWTKKS